MQFVCWRPISCAAPGTRLTGAAVVLRLSPAPMPKTVHHQRDRTLFCGSAATDPSHGVLCERRKCGSHHLLHLPEIQSGVENPHPLRIYTSSLTSPKSFHIDANRDRSEEHTSE